MSSVEFLSKMETILSVGPGSLNEDCVLKELKGWDSLAIVEFQAILDGIVDPPPSPEQIEKCKTIRELMDLAKVS